MIFFNTIYNIPFSHQSNTCFGKCTIFSISAIAPLFQIIFHLSTSLVNVTKKYFSLFPLYFPVLLPRYSFYKKFIFIYLNRYQQFADTINSTAKIAVPRNGKTNYEAYHFRFVLLFYCKSNFTDPLLTFYLLMLLSQ